MKNQIKKNTAAPKRKVSRKPAVNRKSAKLVILRERADAAYKAAEAAGEAILSKGPNHEKWHRILRQIDKLEASFVVYQGKDVDAVQTNYQDGDISITERFTLEGNERLYRDEQGRYYLRRQEWKQPPHVHRLSVRGAILWAVTRVYPVTSDLRHDTVALFAALDRSLVEDANGNVTVPVTLPRDLYEKILAMGAYDEDADLNETFTESMAGDVEAWLEAGEAERKFLVDFKAERAGRLGS